MKPVERKSLGVAAVLASFGLALGWLAAQPLVQVGAAPENGGSTLAPAGVRTAFGQSPMYFEENRGQTTDQVRFLSRGPGYQLFLTPTEQVMRLSAGARSDALRISLVGGSQVPKLSGEGLQAAKSNYFGSRQITDISDYDRVRYAEVYPGIDLVFYGNAHELEYDFVVAPGKDPAQIRLAYSGAENMQLNDDGDLVLKLDGGTVVQKKPVIYQMLAGGRVPVAGRYVVGGGMQVAFDVGAYDASQPLVIDPILSYSTYLGGTAADQANAVATDSNGNVYVAGSTDSTDFPTKDQLAVKGTNGTGRDAFVTKYSNVGTRVYSTYFSGDGDDAALAIAVDSNGNAHIGGESDSSNVADAQLDADHPGSADAFVAKLGSGGNTVSYSTYLSGNAVDSIRGIAVDTAGDIYVTGSTTSSDFTNQTKPGGMDAFIGKIRPTVNGATGLIYLTYLGGTGSDSGNAIALDSTGAAYVAGNTDSNDFPIVSGSAQTVAGGLGDAFVTKLNALGNQFVYSSYLGGSGADAARGLALDGSGNAYLTGFTDSANFPSSTGAPDSNGAGRDAFVTKFNPGGTARVYSTYLSGGGEDEATAIAVDGDGQAYVTGFTGSADLTFTTDPNEAPYEGNSNGDDVFVIKLNTAGTGVLYHTYLGGNGADRANGIALDKTRNAFVVGVVDANDFDVTAATAPQSAFGGVQDAFVSKISVTGTLRFTKTEVKDNEGAGASTVVKVIREGQSTVAITATCTGTAGTATSPSDFTGAGGTLFWEAGDNSEQTCPVNLPNDNPKVVEDKETVIFTLSNVQTTDLVDVSARVLGANPASATLTILDDEKPGHAEFAKDKYRLPEGTVDTATSPSTAEDVMVARVDGSDGELEIICVTAVATVKAVSTNGLADASDFTARGAATDTRSTVTRLRWANGDATPKRCPVVLSDDANFEKTEEVALSLLVPTADTPSAGTRLQQNFQLANDVAIDKAVLELLDNDGISDVRFTASSFTGSEEAEAVTLTLQRIDQGAPIGGVSVCVETQNGLASAPADFARRARFNAEVSTSPCGPDDPARVFWASGDNADKTIEVAIADDSLVEGNETFTVFLSEPLGHNADGAVNDGAKVTLGTPNSVNVTVTDNDTGSGSGTTSGVAGSTGIRIPAGSGILIQLDGLNAAPFGFATAVSGLDVEFLTGAAVTVANMDPPGSNIVITATPPSTALLDIILACTADGCARIPADRIRGSASGVLARDITIRDGEGFLDADGVANGRVEITLVFVRSPTATQPGGSGDDDGGGALGLGLLLVLLPGVWLRRRRAR